MGVDNTQHATRKRKSKAGSRSRFGCRGGSLRASLRGAALLTSANRPAQPGSGLGVEGGPPTGRGRGALLSGSRRSTPRHPEVEAEPPRPDLCNSRIHRPPGHPASPSRRAPAERAPAELKLACSRTSSRSARANRSTGDRRGPRPTPPRPEPSLELARHPKSSAHIPASPQRRVAAALLPNSKAHPSLNL